MVAANTMRRFSGDASLFNDRIRSVPASGITWYSGIDLSANGGGSTASALVGLGHRLEQLQPAAPVMPIQHYTDRKVLQKEREKKIALGHKADDHEDEVSYDWQQTM